MRILLIFLFLLTLGERLRVTRRQILKSNMLFKGSVINLFDFLIKKLNCVLNIFYLTLDMFHVLFTFL